MSSLRKNLKETDNGNMNDNTQNKEIDFVGIAGITGNYYVMIDFTTGVYHMIELDSVSDEKISSWDIKF